MPGVPHPTAAAVQMQSGPDLGANLARARELAREAAARGATLIVLPEVFAWRGLRTAEPGVPSPIPGPVSEFLCGLAADLRVTLVGGSFLERSDDDAKSHNTSLVIDPTGTIRGAYRKMHLFDVDLPGEVTVRESEGRIPGAEVVTATTELGTIGLSVCYDLRFPELYRILALRGARIVTVPANFTRVTGEAHWEVLLRARAIENQLFVIAPGQGSQPGPEGDSYGNSMIVDPWGEILARAGGEGESFVAADLDLARQDEVREKLPSVANRVASAYRWPEAARV